MREQIHQHVLFSSTRQIGQWFPTHNSPAYLSALHKTSSEVEFLQTTTFCLVLRYSSTSKALWINPFTLILLSYYILDSQTPWEDTEGIIFLWLQTLLHSFFVPGVMTRWGFWGGGITSFNSHNNLVRWILISMFLWMRKFSNFPKVTSVMRYEDNT